MSAAVDVLAVLDALLAFASRGVEMDDPVRPMIEGGHEARAAMAELIEADRQLDKCEAAVASHVVSEEADEAWEATALELYRARDVAAKRRAAALAGVGGES